MAQVKVPKKADTKLLFVAWGLGLGLIIFYVGYWVLIAQKIESRLAARKNADFTYSSAKIDGFPYRFTLKIKDLNARIGHATQFEAEEFSASASTFEPQLWVLEGAIRPTISEYSDSAVLQYEIKPKNFQSSLRLDLESAEIQRLSIQFDGIETKERIIRRDFALGRGEIHLIKDDAKDNYAFAIEFSGIANSEIALMPSRFLLRGLLNNPQSLNRGLDYWARRGGVAQIKYGVFGQKGDAQFADNLRGTLNFDANGKFSGKIDGDIEFRLGTSHFGPIAGAIHFKNSDIDEVATAQELLGHADFTQYQALLNSGMAF